MDTTTKATTSNDRYDEKVFAIARAFLKLMRLRRHLIIGDLALRAGVDPDLIISLEDHEKLPKVDIPAAHVEQLVEVLKDPLWIPTLTWQAKHIRLALFVAAGHWWKADKDAKIFSEITKAVKSAPTL